MLALAGAGLAFVPGVPEAALEPELALALFVAPAIGVWSLVRELRFGRDAQRLFTQFVAERGEPQITVIDRRDRAAVDALIATPVPSKWQDALLLGLTLDTVGRRREGRAAVRKAISAWAIDSRS